MKEAIIWAKGCSPKEKTIPKVGAIIAVGEDVLGRGRRGTGIEGDEDHAEKEALKRVEDKAKLPSATLYTTLEPCTHQVRTYGDEACTELIHQHQIKRVFVGMLDPNQGVTGKGLWSLQDRGIEVALFPHELSKEIRAENADFIRSQKGLSASIVQPRPGDEILIVRGAVRQTVRFTSENPPGDNACLLAHAGGSYWPQPSGFSQTVTNEWEAVAYLGSAGEYTLQIVTADTLGSALIRYYRKVGKQNSDRRDKLKEKLKEEFDPSMLGNDYPGIEMNGLPKGLRLEAEVAVNVVPLNVTIVSASVEPKTIERGKRVSITYEIRSSHQVPNEIWLGASFRDEKNNNYFNTNEDRGIVLNKGQQRYERNLTAPMAMPLGEHRLMANVWMGVVGDSRKSTWLAGSSPGVVTVR